MIRRNPDSNTVEVQVAVTCTHHFTLDVAAPGWLTDEELEARILQAVHCAAYHRSDVVEEERYYAVETVEVLPGGGTVNCLLEGRI